MQYLVSVIDDGTGLATSTEEAATDAFNDRLRAEGHWVFAGGLGSPDPATVVDNRGGEAMVTDGPTTRPARTCCAGCAAARSRARRTTEPSSWRATPPRPPT